MSENETYDPTAPEGASNPGGQYVSKRDVRILIAGFVGVLALLYPIFLSLKGNTEKTICVSNSNQIYKAISLYATDHDDRFPPIFASNSDGTPMIDRSGYPYTWISDVAQFMGKGSFLCPSADRKEAAEQQSKDSGKNIRSTYGMYAAYSGFPRNQVESPDSTILFAETANFGSRNTFDPLPFGEGNDGFAIGWNQSNVNPTKECVSMTRLAFPDTSRGLFKENGAGRHGGKINAITASGEKSFLPPSAALIQMRDGWPSGIWAAPMRRN